MKYAYYPGCSLHSTATEYDATTRAVCAALGVELAEIPDWNCCGATSAHATNHLLSLALPARDLVKAENMGLDVVAPCAACYSRMATTLHETKGNEVLRRKVSEIIGADFAATAKAKSLLEVLAVDVGPKVVETKVQKPLKGLKVAAYYGCLLVRPPDVTGWDDAENPQSMERLMTALGAEAVDWPFKTECCGASLSVSRTDVVLKLVNDILAMAKSCGADALVCACPMCQANLDGRQPAVEKAYKTTYHLPVFYFTQLMSLAMGIDEWKLGFRRHSIDPRELLHAKEIA
ncbi:MAG TPA: CoB--CoM heterodisulfide reductase iron-sulfur subunit B family protein [Bacillota bacterium]